MNKPITIVYDDFIKNLTALIQQSGLPFFVIENVLRQTQKDMLRFAAEQLQNDRHRYEEYLAKNAPQTQIQQEE